MTTDGQHRAQVKPGQTVSIVLKKDQGAGALTQGIVKTLLTKSPFHYLGLAIIAEVVATSALKASAEFSRFIPSMMVVVGSGEI